MNEQPGLLTNSKNETVHALNCMCNLTQCSVSSLLHDPTTAVLAEVFMQEVVLSFGVVAVVVVDADNKFCGTFEEACNTLKITFWTLARVNHKGNSVERYHCVLDKTQTICGTDRGTHHTFATNIKTPQYAWNTAPIDNTNIP